MSVTCPECGAPVAARSCRDNFDALLGLEWQVPGGAGRTAHFYAVASYVLQHPDSMSYTIESVAWLRSKLSAVLAGEMTTADIRRGVAAHGVSGAHVTRRPGDPVPEWPLRQWSMNVADILAGGVDGYAERVHAWADSVLLDLDAAGG